MPVRLLPPLGPLVVCVAILLTAPLSPRAQTPSADIDALIAKGAVNDAVSAFDAQMRGRTAPDATLLARLSRAVLADVAASPADPSASVEACLTLIADATETPRCQAGLATLARKSVVARLRMRARTIPESGAQADRAIAELTTDLLPRDWNAVVDAAADFPPPIAVRLLTRALAEGSEDVRFGALDALSRIDHPSAVPVLRTWSARQDSPARLIALAAVARAGDRQALATIRARLPELHGQDLLAAGTALATHGDAAGVRALEDVLRGPEELLQIEAAAALEAAGSAAGRGRLDAELTNPNVWIRLKALEKLRGRTLLPTAAVWRQLSDPMPWVRVRAAQVILDAAKAPMSAPR